MSKERVKQLQQTGELPPDMAVSIISDQSISVKERIREVVVNISQAIVIVVLVVFLFVGFRTAAVMAANIPFVVLVSLAIVPAFGVQLEQMSLASMIIALGLLVDNAVQICDQTVTNQLAGMKPKESAVKGAQLLGASMLNGTLTTIAAFIPMVIAMDGSNREFIYSLPITLSVMLAVSWVLAMTFCVILAAWFIRPAKDPTRPTAPLPWLWSKLKRLTTSNVWPVGRLKSDHLAVSEIGPTSAAENSMSSPPGGFFRIYGVMLAWTLRHRAVTLAGAFGILVLIMQLPVSAEFFPLTQRNQFAVKIFLPESSSIEQTDQVAQQVEEAIRKLSPYTNGEGELQERLLNMRTIIGGGGSRWYLSWEPEFIKPNFAEVLIQTTDGKLTHEFAESLRNAVQEGSRELGITPIVGARVVPIELLLGPPADPVVLRVVGDGYADMTQLRSAAYQIKAMIDSDPDTWDVNDSWGASSQQLYVDVADDRMGVTGIRNSEIASSLNSFYSGRLLTQFREGNRLIPVYFRYRPEDRKSIGDMQTTYIESRNGKFPLSAVAEIVPQWRSSKIDRRNGNRTIEVRSQVVTGASGNDLTNRIFKSPAMDELRAKLPVGMRVEIGGALEESEKAQWKMLASFGMSIIAVFVLLICQFNSVFRTSIIIATLPLALGGALLGLWLTNNPIGFMPQLGILALFGIVLNAAILFVEFADIMVRQAQQEHERRPLTKNEFHSAIVSAGRQRLMPIFLTTATTVGGLIPLALSGGPLWVGMAWLLISGLTFATVLTLLIIPVLYSFQRIRRVTADT
jgi:multidrug efflux pump subunit AcrB